MQEDKLLSEKGYISSRKNKHIKARINKKNHGTGIIDRLWSMYLPSLLSNKEI